MLIRVNLWNGFICSLFVVWGLFIINSFVFFCILDVVKEGDEVYVSWYVEIVFI